MPNTWMVRSSGGDVIEEFRKGYVALGFGDTGDLSNAATAEELRDMYVKANPNEKPGAIVNAVNMLRKFRSVMQIGDNVVTYDPALRRYYTGTISSDYFHQKGVVGHMSHLRRVKWTGEVSRDSLRVPSRNSLGSTLTLFGIAPDVWDELNGVASGAVTPETPPEEKVSAEVVKEDTIARARELIKDKINQLDDHEMEHLTAAILRAMGFKTRVSARGADRGVDVFASPDGLGLQEPRIKVEVKHRSGSTIGSQDLRSFLGGLRPGDRGLYVSTGGFTKEAKYEAERANTPVTLLALDDIADLVLANYDNFDLDGRALIALVKIYWPAE